MRLWSRSVKQNIPSIDRQIEIALKSVSLPQVQPKWQVHSRKGGWSTSSAIQYGYNSSAVVYASVEKRAKLVSSVPWVVKIKKPDGTFDRAKDDHPLAVLIEDPNPDHSFYEIMYLASQSLDLSGNAYISEVRAGVRDIPVQLWHLPPQDMSVRPSKKLQLVDYYEYGGGIRGVKIKPRDMVHMRMPNPSDPIFGMPLLMAAGRAADIDREAGTWQKTRLQGQVASDIHVEVPESTSSEQIESIKKRIKEKQSGPANAGEPIVSSGKVNLLGQTARELDFISGRKAVWTEIAAVFGVPLATMGFTEDVNLANAESMDRQLWNNTIIPQLELIKRQLNKQLARDFGGDVFLDYDTSNVQALQENEKDKIEKARILWGMGVPLAVLNDRFNLGFKLEGMKGVDTGYIPSGLLPVGFEDSILSSVDGLTEEEMKAIKKATYGNW